MERFGLILISSDVNCYESFQSSAIDFSEGTIDEDGVLCVEVEEERNSIEQDQEQQCTQQNVEQCFNDYVTEYRDDVRERCEEEFLKVCRIVMRQRSYNHTTRVCRRPLVQECDQPQYGGYQAPGAAQPQLVCETFYETECKSVNKVIGLLEKISALIAFGFHLSKMCRFSRTEAAPCP